MPNLPTDAVLPLAAVPAAAGHPLRAARSGRGPVETARPRRPEDADDDGGSPFRLGWKGWVLIDVCVVAMIFGAVIAWPIIQTCRDQDRRIGFYAGDSVDKCIRRGIKNRFEQMEQRIKMVARRSGA